MDGDGVLETPGSREGVIRGDFGTSLVNRGKAAIEIIWERLPNTLILMIPAEIIVIAISLLVGIYSALRQYSLMDHTVTALSFIGYSMPIFFIALVSMYIFGVNFKRWGLPYFPTVGMFDPKVGKTTAQVIWHMVLPIFSMTVITAAGYSRYVRSQLLEVISENYIRTAKAKGLPARMITYEHALKNAALPLVTIIGLDKEPTPDLLKDNKKIKWVGANTSDNEWKKEVSAHNPDIVIHTAWQIREMYGDRPLEWKWNIDGSDNVFDLSFNTPSVKRLIHFSTVSSYGAFADNSTGHNYKEDEPFRQTNYLYSEEKRVCEKHLEEKYAAVKGQKDISVAVLRPAAITGPRGRFARIRFGLQASLSGSLKGRGSILYDIISLWVSFVPVTPKWLRQYVHEDDVTDIVSKLAFEDASTKYEAFNLAPSGKAVYGKDMAKAVGKKRILVYPWMVRLAFFWVWHLTRGHIPTAPGSWKGYSYPICVDGSKITKMLGYKYRMPSFEAFTSTKGRYEYEVPKESRQ